MNFVIWDDSYNIGHEIIDSQHLSLVQLTNCLHVMIFKGNDPQFFKKALQEVLDYADYHFKQEEEYMQKLNFRNLEEHKEEHVRFREQLHLQAEKIKFEDCISLLDFADFLKTWLLQHILGSDQELKDY